MTPQEFAAKIKAKHPQYADMDDNELAEKMVQKYPQYKADVSFDPPGFMDRMGESSNLMKAISSPLDTLGSLAKSSMPQNWGEALNPMMIPSRMMMDGMKGYAGDVADRESRLFERMNDDPESMGMKAAQMMVAPLPFVGKLVEPLEDDIVRGNYGGAAGSVAGVGVDALASRLAPSAPGAAGQIGTVTKAGARAPLKPLGQKLYSGAVAREAARKSVPHVDNPTPYIRNPYNPIMLAQDVYRSGGSIARSSTVERLQKSLGKKLNPEVTGSGQTDASGMYTGDVQPLDNMWDDQMSKLAPPDNVDKSSYTSQNPRGTHDFSSDDIMKEESRLQKILDRDEPINATRIQPDWTKAVDENGRPITGATSSRGTLPGAEIQRPPIMDKLDQDYNYINRATEQELADLTDYENMKRGGPEDANFHRPSAEDLANDESMTKSWENQADVRQLLAKGIPKELIRTMTPEQIQAALTRKGTRASGTNPRSLNPR